MNNQTKKTRKRSILLEVLEHKSFPKPRVFKNENPFQVAAFEPLLKNRFIVELEDNNQKNIINSNRIKSCKFFQSENGDKKIVIESYLATNEWMDEFLKVEICKIFILNPVGDVISYLDYDIVNSGYEYELNYSKDDLLTPKIFYTIL